MTRIAFIVLAHKNPDGLIRMVRALVSRGDCVAIHYDKRAPEADFRHLREALRNEPSVVFARRTRCGWGEWSLVQGTLNGLRAAMQSFSDATHFYLVSGDCLPIKPRAYMARILRENDCDHIEHHDFFRSDWIKIGLKEERLRYRHWFNERGAKWLFYASMELQKQLGLERTLPPDLRFMIGSQWFLLRRATVERVLALIQNRRDIVRFFRTTWIPDETFFQTLVLHVTPREEVVNRSPTFKAFSDYGMPVVFHDDHTPLLKAEDCLFARKVSENATGLHSAMITEFKRADDRLTAGASVAQLHGYLTGKGRRGERNVERFWETGSRIGRGREIVAVVCKKWHVGKRVSALIEEAGGAPSFGYVFDEDTCVLPDLGGIERSRVKRGRHRRSFMALLFEVTGASRLVICLDPAQTDAIADFQSDECWLTVVPVETDIEEGYLVGHAQRIGLINGESTKEVEQIVVSNLAREFKAERDRLLELRSGHLRAVGHGIDAQETALVISESTGANEDAVREAIRAPGFFE